MVNAAETENTWVILGTSHGKYICRATVPKEHVRSAHVTREHLNFAEVHEFLTQAQLLPDPTDRTRVSLTKEGVLTPLDLVSGSHDTCMDLAGTRLTFLDSLPTNDQRVYKELIAHSQSLAKAWAKARSPLTLIQP